MFVKRIIRIIMTAGIGFVFLHCSEPGPPDITGMWMVTIPYESNVKYKIEKDIYGIYNLYLINGETGEKNIHTSVTDIRFDHPYLSVGLRTGTATYLRLKMDSTARRLAGRLIHADGSSQHWTLTRAESIN